MDSTKRHFLARLHVAVFYESGTDRKRTLRPIDQCFYHQNRRWFGWLTGDVLVESLFARDFGQKFNFMVRHSKTITFYDPKWTRPKDIVLTRLHVAVFHESGTDQKRTVTPIDLC